MSAGSGRGAWLPAGRLTGTLVRLAAAGLLGGLLAQAAAAPEVPLALKAVGALAFLVALVAPGWGLVLATLAAPCGQLLTDPPVGGAEAVAWCFLAGWLAGVWRRLDGSVSEGGLNPAGRAAVWYAAALAISWLALIVVDSAGVPSAAMPGFIGRAIPWSYLVFSSPEPETWSALRALTGVALFASALALTRREPDLAPRLAGAIALVAAGVGVATLGGVLREWAGHGFGGWFLWRYVAGVRYSVHLSDLNAAGSLFVLGGLIAASRALTSPRRSVWLAAVAAMLPGLWLSGSRSAVAGALGAGVLMLVWGPGRGRTPPPSRRTGLMLAGAVAVVIAAAGVSSTLTEDPTGTAWASMSLRSEFTAASARMFASAPITGVGIGRYYPRSAEFMSERLHAIYPYENAHNYLFQQFAELGVVGGGLFVFLLAVTVGGAWRQVRQSGDPLRAALLTGVVAYLTTCLTGHPLLVPETAFPFWVILGGLAAGLPAAAASRRWRMGTVAVPVCLLIPLGVSWFRANDVFPSPADRGFHDELETAEGLKYRWTTGHAVAWVQPDVGFLTVDVQAPSLPGRDRPFMVQLEADGRIVQRARVPPGQWTQVGVRLRTPGRYPRRRIDLRVNQTWTEARDRPGADATDTRPRGVMAGYPMLHEESRVTIPR